MVCRLLSETVRGMTHEDIVSLARAAHGHPMKLTDLRQVGLLCIKPAFLPVSPAQALLLISLLYTYTRRCYAMESYGKD